MLFRSWEGHTRDNNIGNDLVDEETSRTTKNVLLKVKVQVPTNVTTILERFKKNDKLQFTHMWFG